MAKTRVALVLSGGTSAGAYIAGALDELIRAFKGSEEHEIDVIVGASAGATNAAIIAHGLCFRDGETDLHKVWVEDLDILDLLAPDLGPDDPISVLSPSRLRQVAKDTIAWPPERGPGVRARFCADDLKLAMTLANSTPLSYQSRIQQPTADLVEPFVQERSAEQETYELGPGIQPADLIWERVAMVAQASAAIPFIFPMIQLARRADGPGQYIQQPSFTGERKFWYYDGGTYNNLPIDLAWYYITTAARQDGRPPLDNRRIVVVNPWRNTVVEPKASAPYPGLLAQAFGLLGNMRKESSTTQFDHEVRQRLASIGSTESDSTESELEAIPGVDRPMADVLGTFALVMPRMSQPPLRCVYLNALSAFLDRRFREYDFRRGAADARRLATRLLEITKYAQRPAEFYEPDSDPAARDIGDYAVLSTIRSTRNSRRSVRRVFEDALDARIDAVVRRLDLPGPDNPLTDAIASHFVKKAVRERLPSLWNPQ